MKEQQDKQAFFALYIGQQIYRCSLYNQKGWVTGAHLEELGIDRTVEEWLQLKTLSAISDEDAIEVAKQRLPILTCNGITFKIVKSVDFITVFCFRDDEYFTKLKISAWNNNTVSSDYLRSKGYLLPFREYTTENIIALGWAKID